MYIIVGLGNPGSEYAKTRHNAGFEVIKILADRFDIATDFIKHKAVCGKGVIEGNKVMLAMPQTFMNLSGESVRELTRKSGSAGGHNGMKSIISCLGTNEFIRVRVGVGAKPKGYDLADHVLGTFTKDQADIMAGAFIDAANAVVSIMNDGVDAAMNTYNRSKKEDDESV